MQKRNGMASRVISSLNNQSIKPSKIILVDNSSDDGSAEFCKEKNCVVLKYDKDEFNYSYALNLGIKETSAEEILILSAHCELMTEGSVQNMIEVRHAYKAASPAFLEDKFQPSTVTQLIQET